MLVLIEPALTAAFNGQKKKKIGLKFREAHCRPAERASICQLSGALFPLTGLVWAEQRRKPYSRVYRANSLTVRFT